MVFIYGLIAAVAMGAFFLVDGNGSNDDEASVDDAVTNSDDDAEFEDDLEALEDSEAELFKTVASGSEGSNVSETGNADEDDVLFGTDEDDRLPGRGGDDLIFGNDGDDILRGSMGFDTLDGGAGDDALLGGRQDDMLSGGAGHDTLFGGVGNDTLNGIELNAEAPRLEDTDEGDYLNAGGGDDLILVGRDDVVSTGYGRDTIVLGDWIDEGHSAEIIDFAPARDELLFVWDDSEPGSEAPDVTVVPDPDNIGVLQVRAGETLVASVGGNMALNSARLSLMPLSSAAALGLAT